MLRAVHFTMSRCCRFSCCRFFFFFFFRRWEWVADRMTESSLFTLFTCSCSIVSCNDMGCSYITKEHHQSISTVCNTTGFHLYSTESYIEKTHSVDSFVVFIIGPGRFFFSRENGEFPKQQTERKDLTCKHSYTYTIFDFLIF